MLKCSCSFVLLLSAKMSLTLGAFKVFTLFQNIIPPPFKANFGTQSLTVNPAYQRRFHTTFRYFGNFAIAFALIFSIWRILWLFSNWKLDIVPMNKMEQLVAYILVMASTFLALSCCHVITLNHGEMQYAVTQRCVLFPIATPFLSVKPCYLDLKQTFVFLLSLGFAIFAVAIFSTPFVGIDFDPIQLMFGTTLYCKILASFVYSLTVAYGASILLSYLLISISLLEGIQQMCEKLLSDECTKTKFDECHNYFQIVRIFINMVIVTHTRFLIILLLVGEISASCAMYATFRMFNMLPLVAYLGQPVLAIMCISCGFLLTYLSDELNTYGESFKMFWSSVLRQNIVERKVLAACPPIGLRIGMIGHITSRTALDITSSILQGTVHLLLLYTPQ